RENPRAGAETPAVAPAVVGAERGHAVLPGRALEPGDERSLRRDDPGAGPGVSADRAARRAAGALDGRGLGAERRGVPRSRGRRQGPDGAVRVDGARSEGGAGRLLADPEAREHDELLGAPGLHRAAGGRGVPDPEVPGRALFEAVVSARESGDGA